MVDTRRTSDPQLEWLRALYESTFDEVSRYARRLAGSDGHLADDLVQEVYVRAVRAVRDGRERDLGIGWLIVAVRHRFVDHVRVTEARARSATPPTPDDGVVDPSDDGLPELTGLTSLERLALVLHHVDGWPVRDVAREIGKSTHATESILARARARARRALERELDRD